MTTTDNPREPANLITTHAREILRCASQDGYSPADLMRIARAYRRDGWDGQAVEYEDAAKNLAALTHGAWGNLI